MRKIPDQILNYIKDMTTVEAFNSLVGDMGFSEGEASDILDVYTFDDNMDAVLFDKLIPLDNSSDQFFGKIISYDNEWLVVSSIYDDDNGYKSGAV